MPRGSGREWRLELPFRPGEMPPLFGETDAALIVDDDPSTVALLSSMLSSEGYRCTPAYGAEEARLRLEERDFAIAMVDVLMPDGSGLELVERSLDLYPFLAVVMVTGVDDPEIAELALDSGAYGYIVKPFTLNEVLIAVSNAGRRRCLEIESWVYRRRLERHNEEQSAELDAALMQLKLLHEQGDPRLPPHGER